MAASRFPVCRLLALTCFFAWLLPAQSVVSPETAKMVDAAMDGNQRPAGKLDCKTQTFPPFLDFALRFEAGFVTNCDLGQFEGKGMALALYVRVIAANGKRNVFGDRLNLPAASDERKAHLNWRHFHDDAEFSGAVALGEGRYKMEVLLVDERNRIHRKAWDVKVEAHGKERSVMPAIKPYSASAISVPPWEHSKRPVAEGRRLTVLMDVAPLVPWSLKLRAWDRAFLLGSLSSLLRQAGASDVRVVAFNLDQQREIYRQEHFDNEGFVRLARELQALELGTVSYRTLQNNIGWASLLVKLVNGEAGGAEASDAVVFLGPNARILDKIAPEAIRARADIGPRLFYFEYFFRLGYEFPDTIQQLTSACRGTVFKIHSAADFAASIAKLQRRLDADDAAP